MPEGAEPLSLAGVRPLVVTDLEPLREEDADLDTCVFRVDELAEEVVTEEDEELPEVPDTEEERRLVGEVVWVWV